jgi:hypothetical protein
MLCGLAYDHEGLHWDTKHNHRWDSPMIRHGDFERSGIATEMKRKRYKVDELAPTETSIDRVGQVHLYRPNVLAQLREMEEDIASLEFEWYGDPYHSEW